MRRSGVPTRVGSLVGLEGRPRVLVWLPLVAIPVAVFCGFLMVDPQFSDYRRTLIHGASFMVCHPFYYIWLHCYRRGDHQRAALIGLGSGVLRVLALLVLGLYVLIARPPEPSAYLLLYLASVGSFLCFQVASIVLGSDFGRP